MVIYDLFQVSAGNHRYSPTTGRSSYTLTESINDISAQEASGPEHGGCYSAERGATPFALRDEGMVDLPVLDCNRSSSQHCGRAGTCTRGWTENVTGVRQGATKLLMPSTTCYLLCSGAYVTNLRPMGHIRPGEQ